MAPGKIAKMPIGVREDGMTARFWVGRAATLVALLALGVRCRQRWSVGGAAGTE